MVHEINTERPVEYNICNMKKKKKKNREKNEQTCFARMYITDGEVSVMCIQKTHTYVNIQFKQAYAAK